METEGGLTILRELLYDSLVLAKEARRFDISKLEEVRMSGYGSWRVGHPTIDGGAYATRPSSKENSRDVRDEQRVAAARQDRLRHTATSAAYGPEPTRAPRHHRRPHTTPHK